MLELKGYRNSPIAFVLVAFPPAIRLNMPFGQDAEVIPELNVFSDRASWIDYTGCRRRKGPNFGRVFLMLNYTDITQNTYIQSW